MSSPQAGALTPDSLVAVVPIGSVEQHSRHLPVGTDSMIVGAVAEATERLRPDTVLLCPTIWYGASSHHLGFPGTASLDSGLVAENLTAILLSLNESSSVDRFLVLNGHGGNVAAMTIALERLRRARPGAAAYAASYWDPMFDALRDAGEPWPSGIGHACDLETSLIMAIAPELVLADKMVADDRRYPAEPWLIESTAFPDLTRHGGIGDPTTSSPAVGARLLAAAAGSVALLIDWILVREAQGRTGQEQHSRPDP